MRQLHLGEEATRSKNSNHPEDGEVDAAGIWDEGCTSYPGRAVSLPSATVIEK